MNFPSNLTYYVRSQYCKVFMKSALVISVINRYVEYRVQMNIQLFREYCSLKIVHCLNYFMNSAKLQKNCIKIYIAQINLWSKLS